MSEPPPAYEALQSPYVPSDTKQPASNPDFPPNPVLPPGNYAMPPPVPHPAGAPGYGPAPVHTIIVGSVAFNQNPTSMMCPHCHQQILTKTQPKSGLLTWLLCGGMAIFGCWLCCCIPFCVDSCRDTEHFCPNCRKLLGTYRRI
ncbi:Lipopolysaccharide-induced tumor necrosis factor-alpha factor [Trichostrongylus colubriformis]|uniref:Lipopolysaccharide-induced tumor necrosis factor-alpha factor n=1 Tax=Trichostrongylus colubriformis TaxID=6319 RepID=A0AAN8J2J0_TRICO